jgi:hypothetical protein
LAQRIRESLKVLETLGAELPNHGRFSQAADLLESWPSRRASVSIDDHETLGAFGNAARNAWDLYFIAVAAEQTAPRGRPSVFLREKLSLMLRGALDESGRDTEPQNTQFELLVAARLSLAGLSVYPGEPDLLFDFGTERTGIAAKRVRSLSFSRLSKHLKKAGEQIAGSGHRGWFAVNLDTRFERARGKVTPSDLDHEFGTIFDSVDKQLEDANRSESVLGFLLFGFSAEWIDAGAEGPALHFANSIRWGRWTDDDEEEDFFRRFWLRFNEGSAARLRVISDPSFEGRL